MKINSFQFLWTQTLSFYGVCPIGPTLLQTHRYLMLQTGRMQDVRETQPGGQASNSQECPQSKCRHKSQHIDSSCSNLTEDLTLGVTAQTQARCRGYEDKPHHTEKQLWVRDSSATGRDWQVGHFKRESRITGRGSSSHPHVDSNTQSHGPERGGHVDTSVDWRKVVLLWGKLNHLWTCRCGSRGRRNTPHFHRVRVGPTQQQHAGYGGTPGLPKDNTFLSRDHSRVPPTSQPLGFNTMMKGSLATP